MVFFSGMKIDMAGGMYWFCEEKEKYVFLPNEASSPGRGESGNHVALFLANAPVAIQPFLPEMLDLLEKAAQDLHLEGEMKDRLIEMLQYINDVCTTKVGSTGLL